MTPEAMPAGRRLAIARHLETVQQSTDWADVIELRAWYIRDVSALLALGRAHPEAPVQRLIDETRQWDIYRDSEDVQHFCADLKSRLFAALGGAAGPPIPTDSEKC